mmetsp:Transcript_39581/g.83199  ORF Transcript_39581/g.83199 Transcript_39581/m.83199 type:complete len:245 (+) Transcript_39581:1364-2098(+)
MFRHRLQLFLLHRQEDPSRHVVKPKHIRDVGGGHHDNFLCILHLQQPIESGVRSQIAVLSTYGAMGVVHVTGNVFVSTTAGNDGEGERTGAEEETKGDEAVFGMVLRTSRTVLTKAGQGIVTDGGVDSSMAFRGGDEARVHERGFFGIVDEWFAEFQQDHGEIQEQFLTADFGSIRTGSVGVDIQQERIDEPLDHPLPRLRPRHHQRLHQFIAFALIQFQLSPEAIRNLTHILPRSRGRVRKRR